MSNLIQYLINEEEPLRILIVQFLKELAENDSGVKKDRQQLIIGQIKKSLDVPINKRSGGFVSKLKILFERDDAETILQRYLLVGERNHFLDDFGAREGRMMEEEKISDLKIPLLTKKPILHI